MDLKVVPVENNPLLKHLNQNELFVLQSYIDSFQKQNTRVALPKIIIPQRIMQLYKLSLGLVPEMILYENKKLTVSEQTNQYIVTLLKTDKCLADVSCLVERAQQIITEQRIKTKNSDILKIVEIYNYLSNHVSYGESINAHSAWGAMIEGTAVCEGISLAFCLLSQKCEVPCICVGGYLDGQPHAWNIVWINGQPYHLDVTANIRKNEDEGENYDYLFLKDDDLTNRKWDNSLYPKCLSNECNYFVLTHSFANTYEEAVAIIIRQLQKKKVVYFRMGKQYCLSFEIVERLFENACKRISTSFHNVEIQLNQRINTTQIRYS